jgi:hypothetical protein
MSRARCPARATSAAARSSGRATAGSSGLSEVAGRRDRRNQRHSGGAVVPPDFSRRQAGRVDARGRRVDLSHRRAAADQGDPSTASARRSGAPTVAGSFTRTTRSMASCDRY